MVDVSIEGENAVFEVKGAHKLWALRSRLEIPRDHIANVHIDPTQVGRWWHGVKVAGTEIPGFFAAGTFYYQGEMVFWDVIDTTKTVIVSLTDERYKKLIVEVADPARVVALLQPA